MIVEPYEAKWYVGLLVDDGNNGWVEVYAPEYERVLADLWRIGPDGVITNWGSVVFPKSRRSWGRVEGLLLSEGKTLAPVIKCPLTRPWDVREGDVLKFAEGGIRIEKRILTVQ